MGKREFNRLRKIALALPEVNERPSHGTPCFFLRDKKPLCYYHEADFHTEGSRVALWCPAEAGVAAELAVTEPNRYFRPQASASGVFSDWIGMYLDSKSDSGSGSPEPVDWAEVTAVLHDAYRKIAPKKLSAELD